MNFHIVDTKTGQVIAICSTRRQARAKADKLNLEYGAHRYVVQAQFSNLNY
jgi:hypothetical protein